MLECGLGLRLGKITKPYYLLKFTIGKDFSLALSIFNLPFLNFNYHF